MRGRSGEFRADFCSIFVASANVFSRDSWKALEGTSKEDAKQRYIDVLLDMFDKIAEVRAMKLGALIPYTF